MATKTTLKEIKDLATLAESRVIEQEAQQLEIKIRHLVALSQTSRVLPIVGTLNPENAMNVITALRSWERIDQTPGEILISINSYGEHDNYGSNYTNTFAIFDAIRMAKAAGFKIRMQVQGVCGVQAVYLLQAADDRIITPNSYIMMAEAQFANMRANSAEAAGMIDFRKNLDAQGQKILFGRSNVTQDQFKDKTAHTRTWQVNAAEALELGIVDTVGVHLQPGRQLPALDFKPYADDDTADVRLAKAKLRVALLRERLISLETREAGSFDSGNKTEIVYLFDQVDPSSVYTLMAFAQKFERQEGVNMELVLNTPGGSVHDGLAAMDVLEAVRARGHKVTIRVLGQAASMGGFLLQSADERLIGENARVLVHRISTIFGGSGSQMDEQREQMERLQAQALPKLVSRSTLSVEEVQKRSENKDWWLTGKEAVELGFADKTF